MNFEYLEPESLSEAISLLVKHKNEAKVIAGGTDLIRQMKKNIVKPRYVINIAFIPGLDCIRYDETDCLHIGSLTTIRAIAESLEIKERHPAIAQAASQLASVAIRNMATVGGNICNASPSADMVPALISLSATAKIIGTTGEKTVLLEDFFTGPGSTILGIEDLLVEIQVPLSQPHTGAVYFKHAIRKSIDCAIVGVAAAIKLVQANSCHDARIVLSAVAPKAMRACEAEAVIVIDEELAKECAEVAAGEAQPISDVRASKEYRIDMIKVLTKYAVIEAFNLAQKA